MEKDNQEGLHKLKELVEEVNIAMLCTYHQDHIHSRPMATSQMDDEGNIWFFTDEFSEKSNQIKDNPKVCLCYSDPSKNTYLSVRGSAELVHDPVKMQELYSPVIKAWFPKGLDDPKLTLLKVKPEKAEYWDSNKMVTFFNIIKAVVTGEKYDEGEHGEIRL